MPNYRRHYAYFEYVARHKGFVFVASIRIRASIWLALIHDLSKFLPSEWFPYAETFYTPEGTKQYQKTTAFDRAWLKHQHRNPHHWQHWVLRLDDGGMKALEMPTRYALEMVADWMGAGRTITGRWEVTEWYESNKSKIVLHDATRAFIETVISSA